MPRFNRREFIRTGLASTATLAIPAHQLLGRNVNDAVRLGFISCGGRATGLMNTFHQLEGVSIASLCDPDRSRLEAVSKRFPQASTATDARELLDDENIDAVVVATCNHWHCLAAIWAMQAGKDVYVEKPLSHSQWEGTQTVAAARKLDRICQVGTQQRSDPMQAEIKKFLHAEKQLGNILAARVNRYGVRAPIGHRETPLPIPSTVDYNLWLGPAQDEPLYRDKLQYDWHWDWNTGSGEMGNWGVHVLDDCRNNVFQDQVSLPRRIAGGGGRVAWQDAGQTPNLHFVWFDTGSIPVVIGLTNLTAGEGKKGSPSHPGPGSGYIAFCEGGRLEGQRGRAVAYDNNDRKIKEFRGNSGNRLHQQNFIDAVRAHDRTILNADVEVGHHSTGWCNLANIAYRAGAACSRDAAASVNPDLDLWQDLVLSMEQVMQSHGLEFSDPALQLSPVMEFDATAERFVGPHASTANAFLKRSYRAGFEIPTLS
jgi:hypothetical protein